MTPFADALLLDVFVTASADPKEIMREHARDRVRRVARALDVRGMQSHCTLAGPDEIAGVAKTFRDKSCRATRSSISARSSPLGLEHAQRQFTWHAGNFPDPKRAIDQLHAEHFRVVLHV